MPVASSVCCYSIHDRAHSLTLSESPLTIEVASGLRARRGMWGMLPTFFYSLGLTRDDMNDELEHVVVQGLDEVGYDLVELRQGGTKTRPVLEVRIDRRDGEKVTVDDCARASRALEARLDGGALVSDRYVLRVSSPGERPWRPPAEWRRFVGRWASVLTP